MKRIRESRTKRPRTEKLRLIFEDLTSVDQDDRALDRLNGYKTLEVEIPEGFDLAGYRLSGVEWIKG